MIMPHIKSVNSTTIPYKWVCSQKCMGHDINNFGNTPEDAWWDFIDACIEKERKEDLV